MFDGKHQFLTVCAYCVTIQTVVQIRCELENMTASAIFSVFFCFTQKNIFSQDIPRMHYYITSIWLVPSETHLSVTFSFIASGASVPKQKSLEEARKRNDHGGGIALCFLLQLTGKSTFCDTFLNDTSFCSTPFLYDDAHFVP